MNILIIGIAIVLLIVATLIARKKLREIESVSLLDFARRMRSGAEFRDIEPAALEEILARNRDGLLLVDLRESDLFEAGHIAQAISLPFDDFMHEVLVEESYDKEQAMILICDHGLKSKVAADILGEDEGFSSVLSLRGGMEAWQKYKEPSVRFACCPNFGS
ncbi:MAG: rhodanese-like domain-containing protein [Chloroflexi bacterium]|nr:rhodanese-like domain-containing protein [Chloroflexota bacterium]